MLTFTHQIIFGLLLAYLGLFSTVTQAQYSSTSCVQDPKYILMAEAATKDTSIHRYYYICSNTVMNIKPFDWDKQTYTNTTGFVRPLIFIYPNAHILCGPDGQVTNNCIIRGGTLQLEVTDATFFGLPTRKIANVSVEGFSFTNVAGSQKDSANIYIFGTPLGADLLVKNCIFQNNSVVANIRIEDNFLSSVTVDGSVFSKNKIIDSIPSKNSGLIFSDYGGSIKVTNTLFSDNIVNTSYPHTWYRLNAIVNAIDNFGSSNITSTVDIQNCCFVRNIGISYSLVLGGMYGDGIMSQTSNTAYDNTFVQNGSKTCSGIGMLYMDSDYYYGGYYNYTLGKCVQSFSSSPCKLSTPTTTKSTSLSSALSFSMRHHHVSIGMMMGLISFFLASL